MEVTIKQEEELSKDSIKTTVHTSRVPTLTNKEKEVSTEVKPSSLTTIGRKLRKTMIDTTISTKKFQLGQLIASITRFLNIKAKF